MRFRENNSKQYHNPETYINILGVNVSTFNKDQLLNRVDELIIKNKKAIISSGNAYSMNIAYKDEWYRNFLNQSDIVHVDGVGLNLAAKILGKSLPKRITWADFGWDLAQMAAEKGYKLFFLGAKPGIAQQAAKKIKHRFPNLEIVGEQHGYFNKTQGNEENEAVLKRIRTSSPDMLWVGFGMPLQEKWIAENYDQLPNLVVFTVGAAFDYLSGELKRAPQWMTDNGLEWLGRLLIEPGRLWQRYVVGNPLFIFRVLIQKLGLKTYD